jgi:hypothetical protein
MAFDPLAVFTGAPFDQATTNTTNAFANLGTNVSNIAGATGAQSQDALNQALRRSLGILQPGIQQGRTDISSALNPTLSAIYGGANAGQNALYAGQQGALDTLQSGVGQATGAFTPLMQAAGQYYNYTTPAANMTADAQGLNGPEGIARAQAAFKTTPGYDFTLNQGLDALTRAANAGGMVASGNTLKAAQDYGSGLAFNQAYAPWLASLMGTQSLYAPLATSGFGTAGSGISSAALTGATKGADIYTGTGSKLSDLLSNTGLAAGTAITQSAKDLANLATTGAVTGSGYANAGGQTLSQILANLGQGQIGFNQAQLAPTAQTYANAATADMLGSQNLWGLGINAAKGIAGLPSGTISNPVNALNLGSTVGVPGSSMWSLPRA